MRRDLRGRMKGNGMINAIVKNNDRIAVIALPRDRMKLASDLISIGIRTLAYELSYSDDDDSPVSVTFYGNSDFDNEVIAAVSVGTTLSQVNLVTDLYFSLSPEEQKEVLSQIQEIEDKSINDILSVVMKYPHEDIEKNVPDSFGMQGMGCV